LLEVNPAMTIAGTKAFGGRFLSPGTLALWEAGFRRGGCPRNDQDVIEVVFLFPASDQGEP
jgi:hypothetical protein